MTDGDLAAEGSVEIDVKVEQNRIKDQTEQLMVPLHECIDANLVRPESKFVLPKCELPPPSEFGPIESFVSKAVQEQHEQGADLPPNKGYKALTDAFRLKNDLPLLKKIMLAMRTSQNTVHCLTSVSKKHARLIHMIVRFDPFAQSAEEGDENNNIIDLTLVDAHFNLLVVLVSANSTLLVPTISALWKLLITQEDASKERWYRVHAALATIMFMCPTGKMEMFPIVSSNTPFRKKEESSLRWYYKNCLDVLEYIASMEGELIALMIDRCLEMDVEIKINDGGEVSIDRDSHDPGIFQLDLEEKAKEVLPEDATVDEMADRLDSIMKILFEYIESRCEQDLSNAYNIFSILLRSFEKSILITHKSKFVQFLILHLCGLESRQMEHDAEASLLYREYASKLIEIILDPYRAIAIRQCAACYLASFVSRATYVCAETICEAVSALLRWAEAYVATLQSSAVYAVDIRNQCSLHSLFYTVCQSSFYIMCFRGVDAIEFHRNAISSSDSAYYEPSRIDISAERWTRLCEHPLQPLRYCLESVRSEFLLISKNFDLISEQVLSQLVAEEKRLASEAGKQRKKRRSTISTPATLEKERQTGGVGGMGHGMNPLDSFFPFDPYLLHRSSKHVEPFYGHWEEPLPSSVSDDDNNEENADLEQDEILEEDDSSDTDAESEGDDSDNDSLREHEGGDDRSFEPMSYDSNASDISNKSAESSVFKEPSIDDKRASLHETWANTLKRSRALSIENGSW
ncbi:RNA polymerase I-specific transcription initiation factor RRN3 [Fistulifera solaris]|uniref:RNA polymerase I-specific transcription initiation factor RRN3 n=1 Tax=Fistulifera solaris TaxID=1519565 RepID=A0A1Z5KQW3_FISSO|nr:RNA polymerase I-specific transcription initiation factor RRN3 [Fistulifera solaris]|eukprot:GAX28381.1 RNA polymerase I-specific transcription initiation factor RRN3 [Fistulifera solaris]